MVSNLRDVLLCSLSSLPGTRTFHLHVLTSSPRKHTSLYPYATTRPRVFVQDIFVLLSEQRNDDNNNDNNTGSEYESKSPRVFVSAIEASVFTIPQTHSAVFYVSKVDSTGQGQRPAPTSTLVRALLKFYIDPRTRPVPADRIWVHLFARAQAQYLFPNSAEYEGKKPLGDVKLCSWWKRVFESVAREVEKGKEGGGEPKMFFVLPGMNELEALQALGELSTTFGSAQPKTKWMYGHPYSQTDIPLPYVVSSKENEKRYNLGQFIPSFEDDPKARFMDEIACTSKVDGVASPKRKKRRTSDEGSGNGEGTGRGTEEKGKERVHGELGMVETDEFWERMSFRQECVAGAVTGFFVGIYPWSSTAATSSSSSSSSSSSTNTSTATATATATAATSSLPGAQPGQVSYQMIRRIVSSLMTGYEFSTRERCEVGTEKLEGVIKGLCEGLPVQEGEGDDGGVGHKRGHESVSLSLSSLDTYFSYIYGRVRVDNNKDMTEKGKGKGEEEEEEEEKVVVKVHVLGVRKKVRRK